MIIFLCWNWKDFLFPFNLCCFIYLHYGLSSALTCSGNVIEYELYRGTLPIKYIKLKRIENLEFSKFSLSLVRICFRMRCGLRLELGSCMSPAYNILLTSKWAPHCMQRIYKIMFPKTVRSKQNKKSYIGILENPMLLSD